MSSEQHINFKSDDHTNYYRKHHQHHDYDHHDSYIHSSPSKIQYAGYILKKIWSDKKLRILLLLSLIVIKGIIILAIVLIIPLIGDISEYIRAEGLKGVMGNIAGLLNKLWNGA